jgi:hypothetical protein
MEQNDRVSSIVHEHDRCILTRGFCFRHMSFVRLVIQLIMSRTSTWECTCRTLEEWTTFIDKFRKTCSRKNSSTKDRQLLEHLIKLNADLPEIYARKERDRQRRWTSYEPKRSSNRLEAKRQQRLALEEITQEQKVRHDKFLEYKRRQEETVAKEKERLERYERVKRREGKRISHDRKQTRVLTCYYSHRLERADRIRRRAGVGSSTGVADSCDLSENSNTSSTCNDEANNSLDTTDIHQKGTKTINIAHVTNTFVLVMAMLRTNENSWPFLEPVTEELAPNYFTIVQVRLSNIVRCERNE